MYCSDVVCCWKRLRQLAPICSPRIGDVKSKKTANPCIKQVPNVIILCFYTHSDNRLLTKKIVLQVFHEFSLI